MLRAFNLSKKPYLNIDSNSELLVCNQCGAKFSEMKSLKTHIQNKSAWY
jgi:uncharacterized C2H2 Zn-finger protein